MSGFDGALARKLDFGEMPTVISSTGGRGRAGLRLAPAAGRLAGPDKYRVLDSRRRRAQIAARRLLDLFDGPALQGKL
jgi:hypothetical protein